MRLGFLHVHAESTGLIIVATCLFLDPEVFVVRLCRPCQVRRLRVGEEHIECASVGEESRCDSGVSDFKQTLRECIVGVSVQCVVVGRLSPESIRFGLPIERVVRETKRHRRDELHFHVLL